MGSQWMRSRWEDADLPSAQHIHHSRIPELRFKHLEGVCDGLVHRGLAAALRTGHKQAHLCLDPGRIVKARFRQKAPRSKAPRSILIWCPHTCMFMSSYMHVVLWRMGSWNYSKLHPWTDLFTWWFEFQPRPSKLWDLQLRSVWWRPPRAILRH